MILWGFLASLGAGLMTGVGALPVLFGREITRRTNDMMLGFAAGVMISASFFSLILPGIEEGEAIYGTTVAAALLAAEAVEMARRSLGSGAAVLH